MLFENAVQNLTFLYVFRVAFLQVRKILDLAQSKGEEVAEYCVYVLQQVADAYYELKPWLEEIGFRPSEVICSKVVENTDPGRKFRV